MQPRPPADVRRGSWVGSNAARSGSGGCAGSWGVRRGRGTRCRAGLLPWLRFVVSLLLSLSCPVPGGLMNYPNIYCVWEENTYHIYLWQVIILPYQNMCACSHAITQPARRWCQRTGAAPLRAAVPGCAGLCRAGGPPAAACQPGTALAGGESVASS